MLGQEGTDDQGSWVEKRSWYLNRFSSGEYSYFASPMSMEICNHLTRARVVFSRRTKGTMRLPRRLEFLVGTVYAIVGKHNRAQVLARRSMTVLAPLTVFRAALY